MRIGKAGKWIAAIGMAAALNTAGARDLAKLQEAFLSWRFGMFIHFNMSTFHPGGWATGREDPLSFNPERLDMGQWADAAAAAKMKYAVLTVKHTGGWCLWDSALTDHDITAFKNYKNGKGDLVREFVDAFRARGLKVGFYYCFPLWDSVWTNHWTLPLPGYATGTNDARAFIEGQLRELLTRYGKIDLIWVDQNTSPHGGLKEGDWRKIKAFIHSIQPDCLVIGNNMHDFADTDIISYEYPYALELPPLTNTEPAEVCDKLNGGWFASPGSPAVPVRSADYVVNRMLRPLNDRHCNYLLNCSPEPSGLLNEKTVALLQEIGRMWDPNEPSHKQDPCYGILREAVSVVPTRKAEAALIFPASWSAEEMKTAAEKLAKKGFSGTFFVHASQAKASADTLREIVRLGSTIGNGSKSDRPIDTLDTGLKIGGEVKAVPEALGGKVPAPAVFRAPKDRYSDLVWPVLNYFNLIAVKPAKSPAAGAVIEVASPADLDDVLKALEKKGLRAVSVERLVSGSDSVRLKNLLSDAGAKVVSGAE